MRGWLARGLVALSVLIAAAALGLAVALAVLDVDDYRKPIADGLSDSAGLSVRIDGPLELSMGLRPVLLASRISIHSLDPRWPSKLAGVQTLALRFDLWRALASQVLELTAIDLEGVSLSLQRDAESANWRRRPRTPSSAKSSGPKPVRVSLTDLYMRDVSLSYVDLLDDTRIALDLELLKLSEQPSGSWLALSSKGEADVGAFSAVGRIHRSCTGPQVDGVSCVVELKLEIDRDVLDVAGSLVDDSREIGVDLKIGARIEDPGRWMRRYRLAPGLDVAGLGPLVIAGRLHRRAGTLRLDDVTLDLGRELTTRLRARGRIGDVVAMQDIEFDFETHTSNLHQLLRRAHWDGWKLGSAEAHGRLRYADESLEIADALVHVTHGEHTNLSARGDLTRSAGITSTDLALVLESRSLADLRALARDLGAWPPPADGREVDPVAEASTGSGTRSGKPSSAPQRITWEALIENHELGSIGPVRLSGSIAHSGSSLEIEEADLSVGSKEADWLAATGFVHDVLGQPSAQLTLQVISNDVRALSSRLDLPEVKLQTLSAVAVLHVSKQASSLAGIRIEAGSGERLELRLTGDLQALGKLEGSELDVEIHAVDLAAIGEVLGRTLPAVGPLALHGTLSGGRSHVQGRSLQALLGESRLAGDVGLSFGDNQPPRLTARLLASNLRLIDLGVVPPDAEPADLSQANDSAEAAVTPARWQSAEPLPFAELQRLDADLTISIDHMVGRKRFDLRHLQARLQLKGGILEIDSVHAGQREWSGHSALRVDATQSPPSVELRTHQKGIAVHSLIAQLTRESLMTGELEANVDLKSRGESPRELLKGLRGDVFLYAKEGSLPTEYSRKLQLELMRNIDPEWRDREFEEMNCLVGDFELTDGVAEIRTLLLDTADKQVLSAGQVDLSQQQLNLVLTPSLKDPVPGSVTAAIRITGPFDDPKVRVEPLATATAATQAVLEQTLGPILEQLPVADSMLERVLRSAQNVASGAGIATAGMPWRPGVDVTCEMLLGNERISAARRDRGQPGAP